MSKPSNSYKSFIPKLYFFFLGLNTLHVPPITVSNPSENLGITEKMFDMSPTIDIAELLIPAKQSPKEEPINEAPCEPRKGIFIHISLEFVQAQTSSTIVNGKHFGKHEIP